jgi:tRNA threonylcarbamoyladenosine biosynthesis protein TsaB
MATFIALDTSSTACSVALVHGESRISKLSDSPREHAGLLLPFVDELLSQAGVSASDLDFVACCQGPGSFTGLRIGLGIAQGLAFALNKPMVGVSSLAAMARTVQLSHPDALSTACLLDARMNEIYWAVYEIGNGIVSASVEPNLIGKNELNATLLSLVQDAPQTVIAGEAARLFNFPSDISQQLLFDFNIAPNADAIADLALEKWLQGEACAAKDFQLTYLRNSVSWNKRQRIRS